jgi:hypothetical protein
MQRKWISRKMKIEYARQSLNKRRLLYAICMCVCCYSHRPDTCLSCSKNSRDEVWKFGTCKCSSHCALRHAQLTDKYLPVPTVMSVFSTEQYKKKEERIGSFLYYCIKELEANLNLNYKTSNLTFFQCDALRIYCHV